jgi:hypothetical protein
MKYLVWLGVEEKGTYDIIKKIAKKKFKEEELNELKSKLRAGWVKNVGREDVFNETWQVVEDAAHYSFNASHSLSVAIDSLYEISYSLFDNKHYVNINQNKTLHEIKYVRNDVVGHPGNRVYIKVTLLVLAL